MCKVRKSAFQTAHCLLHSQKIEEKGLIPEQIYNADEAGLLWKCFPQRTLVSCCKKCTPGFKTAKDLLTVPGCMNAIGTHELKPVVIWEICKAEMLKKCKHGCTPCDLQVTKEYILIRYFQMEVTLVGRNVIQSHLFKVRNLSWHWYQRALVQLLQRNISWPAL